MIDINKKYCTRDGREVRIYATDGHKPHCIHGAIKDCSEWYYQTWALDGKAFFNTIGFGDSDLIEVRPRHKRTVWLHVWNGGTVCSTEESYYVPAGRIACIKVELDFAEGDGL